MFRRPTAHIAVLTCAVLVACGTDRHTADNKTAPVVDYAALGVPPTDRVWTAADYDAAADILEKLADDDMLQLPELGAPGQSGALFSRIVSPDNLAIFSDPAQPLGARMQATSEVILATNRFLKLYQRAHLKMARMSDESIETALLLVRCADAAVATVREFVATLDPDDPSYPNRMAGLDQMKTGYKGMVTGALLSLGDRMYPEELRVRFAKELEQLIPSLVRSGYSISAADTKKLIGKIRSEVRSKTIEGSLDRIVETLGERERATP